jgi:hypothetical protein
MSIIGTVLVGALLNSFTNRIDELIQEAEFSGEKMLLSASEQADLTVTNATFAFKDVTNTFFNRLDQSSQNSLLQIDSLITDIEKKTFKDIKAVEDKAQIIVNALPFSNRDPQVSTVTPKFVVPGNDSNIVRFKVEGNFIDSCKPEYKPTIRVGDKVIETTDNTTERLVFEVPISELVKGDKSGLSSTHAIVTVPYGKGGIDISWLPTFFQNFLSLFFKKTREDATFRLLIGILPSSPGKIIVWRKILTSRKDIQHIVTGSTSQESVHDDITELVKGPPIYAPWEIVPGTIQFKIEHEEGDWSYELNSSERPTVSYVVKTIHHGIGTSGKVTFHLEYDVYRFYEGENWVPEPVVLKWGESQVFDAPNGWKVDIQTFDGKLDSFPGGNSKYLRVKAEGSQFNIEVEDAENLDL